MVTTFLRRRLEIGVSGLTGRLDPRASIGGKLVLSALTMIAVTTIVGLVVIWQVTVTLATTHEHAQAVYRGGLLAIVAVGATQGILLAMLWRSLVGGLRELEENTRAVLEKGTFGTDFSSDRADEIGQLSWSVAELQAQLASQVEEIESLNRDLTTVVTTQSRTLAACRQGDLTRRMDTETGTPQFDALAMNFNEMMDRTETMVAEVRSFSRTVADAADEADDRVTTATGAVTAITESTESISGDVSHQRDRVESTARAIDDLAVSIDEIAAEAETVADRSERAARATRAGSVAAESALEELAVIREQTDESVDEIATLYEAVGDVGEIIELISELADRTNQLAVNAQIEAARAEDGDQATRLSKRIKHLATDTDEAAGAIEAELESIERQTERALEEIETTQVSVERGTETIETALGAFEDVADVVEETSDGVAVIESATEVQTERAEDVVDAADDLRTIGERTATEAADVARTAGRQQAEIESIRDRLERLAAATRTLDTQLDVFTVRSELAASDSSQGVMR